MSVHEGQASNVVLAEVHCRRCGYNLFGLGVDGPCPECGLDVWQTILHTVDPAASRLPKLANPRAVGDGLLWVVACLTVIGVALVLRALGAWLAAADSAALRRLGAWIPDWLVVLIPVAAVVALVGVRRMAPRTPGEGKPVRRDLLLLTAGLVGTVGALGLVFAGGAGWRRDVVALLLTVPGVLLLTGLGGILTAIGRRSRAYRMAQGARQGTFAMIVALVALALGRVVALVGAAVGRGGSITTGSRVIPVERVLEVSGNVITAISALMLLIGLAYLLVNSWWIRQAIRRPPPALSAVVGPGS